MRNDLKSAFRQIRRNPGFAAAVILTLGLGVGAVTAVLTLADPMFFRPLPFPNADQIFAVGAHGGFLHGPDTLRAEQRHHAFTAVGNYSESDYSGRIGSAAETSIADEITPGFLSTLGVQPSVGRSFRPEEYTQDNQGRVGIITYSVWQSTFGGRPDVVGQQITFAGRLGRSYTIVGVLPRGFFFPDTQNRQPAVLVPGVIDPREISPQYLTFPLVRLRDGVSVGEATAEMQTMVTGVEHDFPRFEQGRRVELIPLREELFGPVGTPVWMLLAATVCILLLAGANLAHLVTARLRARGRELGTRLAIGASRVRVARLLIVEALVLFGAGAGAALLIGAWLSRLALAAMPPTLWTYRLVSPSVDWRVAGFAMASVAGTAILAAIVPALRATRGDLRATLQPGAASDGSRRVIRSDAVLICAQAATGIALLVTGLLIVRSFTTLATRPLGFAPDRVRTIALELSAGTSDDAASLARRRLYRALTGRIPVALMDDVPGMTTGDPVSRPEDAGRRFPIRGYPVSGSFFHVLGLHLLRGRLFTDAEAFSNAPVAVIDQRAAELLWPGADPIGRSIKQFDGTIRVVVGLVQTVRTDLVGLRFQVGGAFVPFGKAQGYFIAYRADRSDATVVDLTAVASAAVPGAHVTTRPLEVFERQIAQPRFLALLLGALGALAMILTLVGVLGVVTHEVVRRTREIGIRLALGADAARIRRLVLRGALVPAVMGGVLGLSASLWFTGSLRALLYGLDPYDPLIYLSALGAMLLTVALGSLAPAWHASRTNPMTSLRAD